MKMDVSKFDTLVEKVDSLKYLEVEKEAFIKMDSKTSETARLGTAVNWLVCFCDSLVDTFMNQAVKLKSLEDEKSRLEEVVKELEEEKVKKVEEKVEVLEVKNLKVEEKMVMLEEDNDEVRQRGLKGCITVSSPRGHNKQTLFVRQTITMEDQTVRNESHLEMVLRVVNLKARVKFQLEEVVNYYPLEPSINGQDPTIWFVQFGNLQPCSNWDALQAGMKTGFHPVSGSSFTDANVYLNFQVTPRKTRFLREVVKPAHKQGKLGKYLVDERGQILVKQKRGSRAERGEEYLYYLVTTKEEVARVVEGDFNYFKNKRNAKKTKDS